MIVTILMMANFFLLMCIGLMIGFYYQQKKILKQMADKVIYMFVEKDEFGQLIQRSSHTISLNLAHVAVVRLKQTIDELL